MSDRVKACTRGPTSKYPDIVNKTPVVYDCIYTACRDRTSGLNLTET